jgi:uncharacterized OsmC-like protein
MPKAKSLGNKKLELEVNGFSLKTDLPKNLGGDNAYPNPLDLLQASLLACAAAHAMLFTDKLGIDRAKTSVELEPVFNEAGEIIEASIIVYVPADFPPDKETALLSAVQNCMVGRHLKFPRNVVVVKQ